MQQLAPLNVLLHSVLSQVPPALGRAPPPGRYSGFKYKMCNLYGLVFDVVFRPHTTVVNRVDRRLTVGVVNCCKHCCKQTATVGTCCSQSLSVVLTAPQSNRRRPVQLVFVVR